MRTCQSANHIRGKLLLVVNNYIPVDAWWHHHGKKNDRLAILAPVSRCSRLRSSGRNALGPPPSSLFATGRNGSDGGHLQLD